MGKSLRWHVLSSLGIVLLTGCAEWIWGGMRGERVVRGGVVLFVCLVVAGVLTDACFAWQDRRRARRKLPD